MTTKNDITGDAIVSKPASDAYRQNWDLVFGDKKPLTEIYNDIRYCAVDCPFSNEKEIATTTVYCSLLKRVLDYYDGPLAAC